MSTKKKIKYPATHLVHCSSGPVYACAKHAAGIINLMKFMGAHTIATKADPGHECSNCVNEEKSEARDE